MKIVKQLAVFLENQPGALKRVANDLADKSINVLAISVSDTVDHAVVRLIVDKPNEAVHMLEEAGVLVVENDLIEVSVSNSPGQLARISEALEKIGSNMEYAYGSAPIDGNCVIYMRVLKPQETLEKLKSAVNE